MHGGGAQGLSWLVADEANQPEHGGKSYSRNTEHRLNAIGHHYRTDSRYTHNQHKIMHVPQGWYPGNYI